MFKALGSFVETLVEMFFFATALLVCLMPVLLLPVALGLIVNTFGQTFGVALGVLVCVALIAAYTIAFSCVLRRKVTTPR